MWMIGGNNMVYGYSSSNPYLNTDLIDSQFTEKMKKQERIVISALLNAKKTEIKTQGTDLTQKLNDKKTEMQKFASQRVASNLKEGLIGKAAEAAEANLKTSNYQPNLKSPIK